jgi:hypothetical protein
MRTILRAGGLCGLLGAVAAVVLQPPIGLGIIWFIPLVGFGAGLGVAKWLQRDWYGRQLAAGLRAGAAAAAIAGLAACLALALGGPRDTATLLAQSHLSLVAPTPAVRTVASLDWLGMDLLTVAGAGLVGVILAGLVAQLIGWSKSRRAIAVVEQARRAAQQLAQSLPQLPPAPVLPLLGRPTGVPLASARPTGVPLPTDVPLPTGIRPTGVPVAAWSSDAPTSVSPAPRRVRTAVQTPPPAPATRRSPSPEPMPEPAPAAMAESPADDQRPAPRARRRSSARPVELQLTGEMRAALEAWAEEHGTSDKTPAVSQRAPAAPEGDSAVPAPAAARTPQLSKYLNDPAPRPKRNRKKNQTRDWIC